MFMFTFRNLTDVGESDYHYILDFPSIEEAESEAFDILMDYIKDDKYLSAKLAAVTKPDGSFDEADFIHNNFFTSFYETIDEFDYDY